MEIGSFKFPDKCPSECKFREDSSLYGQNSICTRCPVFVCGETIIDGKPFRLLLPEEYRLDWASEWAKFFESGEEPKLLLSKRSVKK
jgi:hypothetical protein